MVGEGQDAIQRNICARMYAQALWQYFEAQLVRRIRQAEDVVKMARYGYFEGLAWYEAFLNSAMLLGGMGPMDAPRTDGGKVFAGLYGLYALYAGLIFIVAAALVFVPVLHRLLHKFQALTILIALPRRLHLPFDVGIDVVRSAVGVAEQLRGAEDTGTMGNTKAEVSFVQGANPEQIANAYIDAWIEVGQEF